MDVGTSIHPVWLSGNKRELPEKGYHAQRNNHLKKSGDYRKESI